MTATIAPVVAPGTPPFSQVMQPYLRRFMPIDEVLYFEAADKYVRVITSTQQGSQPEKLIRTPLRELLPRIDQSLFWQVHRSHVVNVRAIECVSRQNQRLRVHLRGRSEALDVSRMYAHLFKAM
jgi:DNA-binding LytR/AlgR family response regulator